MKIFLNILHLEASPGWGGQEMRILKESQGMTKLGHRVIIGVEKKGGLIKQSKNSGFLTYEIRFKKLFWFISFFKLLYIMKKHKIDILNTHSSSDAWLGGLVAKLLNIPIIRTRHLSTAIKKGLNSKLLYGYLADFVVTTCQDAADIIIKQANKDPKSFTRKEVRDLKEDFDKRQEICPDAQIPGNQLPKEVRERLKQARKERAANTRRN
ncbi:hypothetical protein LCGC14_2106250 [marine sediment metagenome]|uniref:Glycosyltransferase subfamily 4-like N-terminal domain-containing protein n=1 Tax=marine sediment metagenome TaxID=412755 RepID=A0A0F9E8P3_9ZZZZ